MKRKFYLLLLLVVFYPRLHAGNDLSSIGGRAAALGGATTLQTDLGSSMSNQAGMAFNPVFQAGLYYDNRFLLKELCTKSLMFTLPVFGGVLGINETYFGYNLLNKNVVGLGFSTKISKNTALGIQLDWLRLKLGEDYGCRNALTFEGGIICHFTKNLLVGLHIYNPLQIKLSTPGDERIPMVMKLGMGWSFSGKALLLAEAEKSSLDPLLIRCGLECKLSQGIFLRGGITSGPEEATFGLGYEIKNVCIDLAGSIHQVLGFTPRISLVYRKTKK